MVLQGGNKVLEKSIFDDKRDFFFTQAEWSKDNRLQIVRSGTASNTSVLIFTVPRGFNLNVTNVWASGHPSLGGVEFGRVSIVLSGFGAGAILIEFSSITLGEVMNLSLSLPMPIQLKEGEAMRVFASTNYITSGGFSGWLEPIRKPGT